MKKRKLVIPYIASGMIAVSLYTAVPVYAEDMVQEYEEKPAVQQETDSESTEDTVGTAENITENAYESDTADTDESIANDLDSDNVEEPSEDEENPEEEITPSLTSTRNTLYQDETTTLTLNDYSESNVSDLEQELLSMILPDELKAEKLTIPSFEDAETMILADGTELTANNSEISFVSQVKELSVRIKPLSDTLKQIRKLELTLLNTSAEEKEVGINFSITKMIKDGTEESTALDALKLILNGQSNTTDPVIIPDSDTSDNTSSDRNSDYISEESAGEEDTSKHDETELVTKESQEQLVHIYKVIDYSGMHLMNSTISASENPEPDIFEIQATDASSQGKEYFETQKIETAPVKDVSDTYQKSKHSEKDNKANTQSTSEQSGNDPVTDQEKEMGIQKASESHLPVLPLILAVAAAAVAIFVPLAKRFHNNNEEEQGREEK